MLILLLFSFLAGIVTVLSPCILPVLPIVLSGSVGEGKRRPLGIVTGFILSFTFFTLFLATLVSKTGISADALRSLSVIVISLFGISLLFPQLQLWLEKIFSRFANLAPQGTGDGFKGGLLVGLSLGLLWTPCVGPILASVISLALTGSVSGAAFFITLAYSLGTAIPMLAITYGGRQLLQKVPWLTKNLIKVQQGFGVIMIATGLAIFLNLDRQFQSWILTAFPGYGAGLTQLEEVDLVQQQLDKLQPGNIDDSKIGKPMNELQEEMFYPVAPELIGGTDWLNSEPLTFAGNLKGKVVLVDFWTYTCINCIRTLPHLTQWYQDYQDQGLVIIGVHSPEFEFEKDKDNVLAAMADYGITYPVVQDNDFNIWRAYSNRYWPAHYLVDKEGKVRYTHFGEGKYVETENKIRELLDEAPLSASEGSVDQTPGRRQTPETYLGYQRADAYTLENKLKRDQLATYNYSSLLPQDAVGLKGQWLVTAEHALAQEDQVSLGINFLAQTVHLVLAPEKNTGYVTVMLDGQPLPAQYWTADMDKQGRILVDEARKYDLVDLGEDYGRHTLELVFDQGISAYAFTFSS